MLIPNIKITLINYSLGKYPHRLKHRWVNPVVWLLSKIQNSHHCQICGRGESFVDGWLQIDDPDNKDKDECSNVCYECVRLNPQIFGKNYV